jgi:hypothetical protein
MMDKLATVVYAILFSMTLVEIIWVIKDTREDEPKGFKFLQIGVTFFVALIGYSGGISNTNKENKLAYYIIGGIISAVCHILIFTTMTSKLKAGDSVSTLSEWIEALGH